MTYILTAEEQKLRDFGAAVLPSWATKTVVYDELLTAFAAIFDRARRQLDFQFDQSYIMRAEGVDAGGPDFLDALALDLGTARTADESQQALRTRLREVEGAVTRPALLAAIDALLAQAGVVGTSAALELLRDKGHFGDYTAQTGVGGVFALVSGTTYKFTPTVPFELPVLVNYPGSGSWANPRITFATSEDAANDGTYTTTDLDGNGVTFINAAGVPNAADTTVAWTLKKYDVDGNSREGFNRAYFNRGYRAGYRGFVVILPYGTPDSVVSAVRDTLRQRKAFGFRSLVEVNAVP